MKTKQITDNLIEEVALLCDRTKDNRELTREVATLLFRKGERPTAGRVLQLTRRGSMQTINDEMSKWWNDIRSRLDNRLVNPKVPAALLEKQGELIGDLWDTAISQAREELEVDRAEIEQQIEQANEARVSAEKSAQESQASAKLANERREETEKSLATEKGGREAALAEAERWRQQAEQLGLDLERARSEFASQMDKARAEFNRQMEVQLNAAKQAEQQHDESRKLLMVELDGARTRSVELRNLLQKADAAIAALQASESILNQKAVDQASVISRQTKELDAQSAKIELVTAERESIVRAREEDRDRFHDAMVSREAMIEQLNENIRSLRTAELGLQKENDLLRSIHPDA